MRIFSCRCLKGAMLIGALLLCTSCAHLRNYNGGLQRYNAHDLYRGYLAKDETIRALDGKIIQVEGAISRIDQNKLNDVFIELNSRIIVLLRKDEISKISEIGLKNGDNIIVVGNFDGEGVLSKWLTNAANRVLTIDDAQIVSKEQWYDLKNFENPLL